MDDKLIIHGAREHNLQNIHLELPHNALIVFTGVSGSGKSSLAFDTLHAEGQRRYIESLSSYARQFLGQLPKPEVEYISGLTPTISIQQKTAARNPRSTVGTITEIYDFLRVLFARIGRSFCPICQRPIETQSVDQIVERVLSLPKNQIVLILAPLIQSQKGEFKDLFDDLLKRGYIRARVNGQFVRLSDRLQLDRRMKHTIDVVIDRITIDPSRRSRIAEAVEQAVKLTNGSILIANEVKTSKDSPTLTSNPLANDELYLSAKSNCLYCNVSYPSLNPQIFSFNSPIGMCTQCDGLGYSYTFAPDLLITNPLTSIYDGAIALMGNLGQIGKWRKHIYEGVARHIGIDLKKPWQQLNEQQQNQFLYGLGNQHITYEWKQKNGMIHKHGGKWEGVIPQLLSSFKKTANGPRRLQLEKYMRVQKCPSCAGQRLNPQARAVRVGQFTLPALCALSLDQTHFWLLELPKKTTDFEQTISASLVTEISLRLQFLLDVGLHYLTLERNAPTLSGGEAQRIRLAAQIGSGLVGVTYILDEPSIGLHARDNDRLIRSLLHLRNMGNTVLVVEHDDDTMRAADYIVDFGPGAGVRGGHIVAAGTYSEIIKHPHSLTGQYLSGKQEIVIPAKRRQNSGLLLKIIGATHHNLKKLNVDFPLKKFVCVTGVSGSGKSSLVNDILRPALKKHLEQIEAKDNDEECVLDQNILGVHQTVLGAQNIDKVIDINQAPIGRTPRSNPATYIKVFDEIRNLFVSVSDAKLRGYNSSRFSFNRPGGRCDACDGNGSNRLEMDFLADVWVVCKVCSGKRFNSETLQVRYRGKNIHDVLEMDVRQAFEHFEHAPKIRAMLQTLIDVGLDYIKLGQSATTLSGGEAQRIKLARELCRRSTGKTLYILDEPTTGLHFEDIRKLLQVLHDFVETGNSVIVIEHNLDVIKTADWIIDLGLEGGSGGGQIVVAGTPETVAACPQSHTGKALRKMLQSDTCQSLINEVNKKPKNNKKSVSHLTVTRARQHNLKDINARIPRGQMTVFCGPSGSGKSSLALDTIYAEGQRRYVESLSSYARQFLGQIQKPAVQQITGLSPAICIEQKTTNRSPRSTVGTITEIYDYLRILYSRLGQRYCPACQLPIGTQTADEIINKIMQLSDGTKLYLLAPIQRHGQDKYENLWDEIRRDGFTRIRVDGKSYSLDEPPSIDHRRKHKVEVVIDRIVVKSNQRTRLAETVETALKLGNGVMQIAHVDTERPENQWRIDRFSQHLTCEKCSRSYECLNPNHFSFNNILGWCATCEGLGVQHGAKNSLLIRDTTLSLRNGALAVWPELLPNQPFTLIANALAAKFRFSLDCPFSELNNTQQQFVLHGTDDQWLELTNGVRCQYKGVFAAIEEAARVSFVYRQKLSHLVDEVPCTACKGARLRDDAAAVRFEAFTLGHLTALSVGALTSWFNKLSIQPEHITIAGEIVREIRNRLQFLVDVGLEYLTLDRSGPTLSGGESQRIRLASQIGSGLTGVLYVLDEPTIGLHPRDNDRLLRALQQLRNLGNTLILVEHDREVIKSADYLFDFGPGAGDQGGSIVAHGTPKQVMRSKNSLTGQYLSGKKAISIPSNRRIQRKEIARPALVVVGARHHNLKNITVTFPLSVLVAVTGVSGSGKSSLVNEVLYHTLARKLHRAQTSGAAHDEIRGLDNIDKIINVDQDSLGNSPSSNPATYSGVFDLIRQLYAQLPEAKVRGFDTKRFSFNKPGGRCEACEGNGQKKIEMHFLPDVWVECEVCHGQRYNLETLAVTYKEKSIADVLKLRITEALKLFINLPKIRVILQVLVDVGLGYLTLGQPAPTLSGGEAQRVKLAAELARPSTGRTLYILDEPTTGLHFDDVRKLIDVLQCLVDLGNTVITVEHNLDVIKSADWIVDIGPEAGNAGGEVVGIGTPEDYCSQYANAHTAQALQPVLEAGPYLERIRFDPLAALARRDGDVELETIGANAQMPWELDGRKWHTVGRLSHQGKKCRWDGEILAWIDAQVQAVTGFSPTDWSERSIVEIAAKPKSAGWFLHAHTNLEWLVRLVFRVGKNTFKAADLDKELGIVPLNELKGVEIYSNEPRVQVTTRQNLWQEVIIQAHSAKEIQTSAFKKFLQTATTSFLNTLKKLQAKPEDMMPWKLNGERWHLGDKGFPAGRKVLWDRSLLPTLLTIIRTIAPEIKVKWDSREAILFKLPGIGKAWGRCRTKDIEALQCRFLGQSGQFNLSRLEGFGIEPQILRERADGGDVLVLQFVQANHLPKTELIALLREHLLGFRTAFGMIAEADE